MGSETIYMINIIYNNCELYDGNKIHIAFDFETTGFSPDKGAKIIEIGAVKFIGKTIIKEFHTLVNPLTYIPCFITDITGIDSDMVSNAPAIHNIIYDLHDFISDSILVAHNINFDFRFLSSAYLNAGLKVPKNKLIDTLIYSKKIFPGLECYKLDYLAERFKLAKPEHRALSDAHACKELFLRCLNKDFNLNITRK